MKTHKSRFKWPFTFPWRKTNSGARWESTPLAFAKPSFWDDGAYLATHADVADAVRNGHLQDGLHHYSVFGRGEGRRAGYPQWLQTEIRKQAEFEPKIADALNAFGWKEHDPRGSREARRVYADLMALKTRYDFTHVFLLPWLNQGGADLVALRHIHALCERFHAKVLVIFTENVPSVWEAKLPPDCHTIHFGAAAKLERRQQQLLLAHVLLEVKAPIIHNINSALGWEVYALYGKVISTMSRLFLSIFAFGWSETGGRTGYATQISSVERVLQRVLTDNRFICAELTRIYAVESSLFVPLKYPVQPTGRFKLTGPTAENRILWASRLCREKRIDVLVRIAEQLPNFTFDVFGTETKGMEPPDAGVMAILQSLPNVNMMGAFDGFDDIPSKNYLLLLYTSEGDGMPNIILEAHAAGLPVLAPDVGGISEIIPRDSSFLISSHRDDQEYVSKLQYLIANPDILELERTRALNAIVEERSMSDFVSQLRAVEGYTLRNGTSAANS